MRDNIYNLLKMAGYKKIIVRKFTWSESSYLIIDSLKLDEKRKKYFPHGIAVFHDQKENYTGYLAGNYSWNLVKVLEEKISVNGNEKDLKRISCYGKLK